MTSAATAPWLSILLPVHGVGAYLDACVASILDQNAAGIELVFVDDASPGDDAARLAGWQARHPAAVRVVTHERNRGVAAARNTLLAQARGNWLWFVDPDDLMEAGALQALKAILDAHDPDLVLCDFRSFHDSESADIAGGGSRSRRHRAHMRSFDGAADVLSHDRDALVAGLFRTGQMHPWSKIVRRSAWPAPLRFPAGRVFEDLAVYPRLALAIGSFYYAAEVWIAYRQRAGSILSALSDKKLDDWTHALVGYPDEVRACGVRLRADTAFEIAHFAARTLLRAVRRYRSQHSLEIAERTLAVYLARWQASSPLDASELAHQYLRRRLFGRWVQFRWTVWRIGR